MGWLVLVLILAAFFIWVQLSKKEAKQEAEKTKAATAGVAPSPAPGQGSFSGRRAGSQAGVGLVAVNPGGQEVAVSTRKEQERASYEAGAGSREAMNRILKEQAENLNVLGGPPQNPALTAAELEAEWKSAITAYNATVAQIRALRIAAGLGPGGYIPIVKGEPASYDSWYVTLEGAEARMVSLADFKSNWLQNVQDVLANLRRSPGAIPS